MKGAKERTQAGGEAGGRGGSKMVRKMTKFTKVVKIAGVATHPFFLQVLPCGAAAGVVLKP
jgi:hypothetical protein